MKRCVKEIWTRRFPGSRRPSAPTRKTPRLFAVGVSRAELGDLGHAITDLDEAIKLNPTVAKAYANRGEAYSAKREFDRAIADLDKAIKLDPAAGAAYSSRGTAYLFKGDYGRAIADCDEAIRRARGIPGPTTTAAIPIIARAIRGRRSAI